MGSANTCSDNYLQIIESKENGGESVERQFCGTDTPSNFTSIQNRLDIRFKKTVNFAGTGWLINFMAVSPDAKSISYR